MMLSALSITTRGSGTVFEERFYMGIEDLIRSAQCCDLKDCNDCPSRSRTACRERTMQGLACEVERLQRMVVKESIEWPTPCVTCSPYAKRQTPPSGSERRRSGVNG